MQLPKPMLPALLLAILPLISCATQQTPAQPGPSPIRAVPCVELPVIAFHAPIGEADLVAFLAGRLPDPGNVYDTPETVDAIRHFNAARNAVCG